MAVVRACHSKRSGELARGGRSYKHRVGCDSLYSGINGACLQYKIKRMSDCQDKDSAGSGAEAKGAEATSATETVKGMHVQGGRREWTRVWLWDKNYLLKIRSGLIKLQEKPQQ